MIEIDKIIAQLKEKRDFIKSQSKVNRVQNLHKFADIQEAVVETYDQVLALLEKLTPNFVSSDFETEWKLYCEAKEHGAVTLNIKELAYYFAQWGINQQTKDAIEGKIVGGKGDLIHRKEATETYKSGDKVKVIIIKE